MNQATNLLIFLPLHQGTITTKQSHNVNRKTQATNRLQPIRDRKETNITLSSVSRTLSGP